MRRNSTHALALAKGDAEPDLLAKLRAVSFDALQNHEFGIALPSAQAQCIREVIEGLAEGICCFDREGRLLFGNARYAQIYGVAPERLAPGVSSAEIDALTAERAADPAAVENDADSEENADKSARSVRLKDGRVIHVDRRPHSLGGWVEIHQDITEAEKARQVADDYAGQQLLLDWVPAMLWVKDAESRFRIANKAAAARIGRQTPEELIGKNDFELHPVETAKQYYADEQQILKSGQPLIDKEEYIIDPAGRKTWISTTKVPLHDATGKVFGLVGVSRDITDRRQADQLRDGQAEILEMIATSAPLGAVLDRLVRLIETQVSAIYGSILLADPQGARLRMGAAPSLSPAYAAAIREIPIGPNSGSCGAAAYRRETVIVKDIASDPLWESCRDLALAQGYRSCWSTPIVAHDGSALGVFAMYAREEREPTLFESRMIDVAVRIAGIAIERKRAEDRIRFMATHDALTELPNRSLLAARLTEAINCSSGRQTSVAVVFLDVDNFKSVNDSLGHSAGDELLKVVAKRLVVCAGSQDSVIRLGGDEFVLVMADLPARQEAVTETIAKLKTEISAPIRIAGRNIRATSSIGVAIYPKDGADVDTLLSNADAAMYQAKQSGRDAYQFYAPDLNAKARERLMLQKELETALSKSQFVLAYQPQVDLRSGRVFAVEALIRWMHPERGMVPPMTFIPLAEETGLIMEIGDWVIEEACRQNKEWQNRGMPQITVSVNVSPRQFSDKGLAQRVADALRRTGLAPEFLELEVTESLIMQDLDLALETMNKLQSLGVRISIDDFGTGYSSLAALRRFPVQRLKIDRSFIQDVLTNDNDKALAGAMISLGQRLKLRVIAEGVETDEQMRFLRDNNCDEMQGYFFSKPLPAREIEPILRMPATPESVPAGRPPCLSDGREDAR